MEHDRQHSNREAAQDEGEARACLHATGDQLREVARERDDDGGHDGGGDGPSEVEYLNGFVDAQVQHLKRRLAHPWPVLDAGEHERAGAGRDEPGQQQVG